MLQLMQFLTNAGLGHVGRLSYRSSGIMGELLELSHPFLHGVRIASKDLRDVPDAAMSQFDCFNCRKAAAVLFREAL